MRNMVKDLLKAAKPRLFGDISGCYYIGGADTLPRPLLPEEEENALRNGDQKELIEHNLRLVVYIAKRFESTGVGIEDLISIGTIGLIKAVRTYDPEKSIKLATYASRCIENEILMYLRKGNSLREVSLDEPLNVDFEGNELLLEDVLYEDEDSVFSALSGMEDKRSVRRALETLPEREREIIEMRYGLSGGRELTQKEVADRLGISQSYISRLEKRIISRLKECLSSFV